MNQKVSINPDDLKAKKSSKKDLVKAQTAAEVDTKDLLDDSNQELSKDVSDHNLLAIPN